MISFFRNYPINKNAIENSVLRSDLFTNVKCTYNLKEKQEGYPINANLESISISIDKYRSYMNCFTKPILNTSCNKNVPRYRNIKYSELQSTIQHLTDFGLGIEKHKISKIHLSLVIQLNIDIKDLIKTNIYLHKSKYYNHNKNHANISGDIKEFDYSHYKIGFYEVKNPFGKSFLKITLQLKKNTHFKNHINNVEDLTKKENLKYLFEILIKRFNEVVIVDNFDKIDSKKGKQVNKYLNYRFWENISKTRSRQVKSSHMKKFLSIINELKLAKTKSIIHDELKREFTSFLKS